MIRFDIRRDRFQLKLKINQNGLINDPTILKNIHFFGVNEMRNCHIVSLRIKINDKSSKVLTVIVLTSHNIK